MNFYPKYITEDVDLIEVNISSVNTTIIPENRKDVKAVYNGKENKGQSKNNPVKLEELTLDIGSGNMNLKNMIINRFEQNVASENVEII
jgi:hypothetical protein